jgi:hypothetical protein
LVKIGFFTPGKNVIKNDKNPKSRVNLGLWARRNEGVFFALKNLMGSFGRLKFSGAGAGESEAFWLLGRLR